MERMATSGLDPDAISDVVLSHLHFDHAMGVVELFSRLIRRSGAPVTVYGPHDTDSYIAAALDFARVNATSERTLEWLNGVSVELTRPGDARELAGLQVRSVEVPHAPGLECLARRFEAGGRSLVYSGDSTYAPDAMAPLADGADVLVHEAYTDAALDRRAQGLPEHQREGLYRAMRAVHCRAEDAAAIAAEAGVRTLVLTHLVPEEREAELLAAARSKFDGTILIASDGLAFEV